MKILKNRKITSINMLINRAPLLNHGYKLSKKKRTSFQLKSAMENANFNKKRTPISLNIAKR
jgi:hypothetical protein